MNVKIFIGNKYDTDNIFYRCRSFCDRAFKLVENNFHHIQFN